MKIELELHPATEMPTKSGQYLVFLTDEAIIQYTHYSAKNKTWNAADSFDKEKAEYYSMNRMVIAWAEIPTKEEIEELKNNVHRQCR